jgi:hypothetical protein
VKGGSFSVSAVRSSRLDGRRIAVGAIRTPLVVRPALFLLQYLVNCCQGIRVGIQVSCLSASDSRFPVAQLALENERVAESSHWLKLVGGVINRSLHEPSNGSTHAQLPALASFLKACVQVLRDPNGELRFIIPVSGLCKVVCSRVVSVRAIFRIRSIEGIITHRRVNL